MNKLVFSIVLGAGLMASCTVSKEKDEVIVSHDSVESSAVLLEQEQDIPKTRAVYHASETILTDLIHTSLQVNLTGRKPK